MHKIRQDLLAKFAKISPTPTTATTFSVSKKKKTVSFRPFVDVAFTFPACDYDRTCISVDAMSKADVLVVLEMKREMRARSLQMYKLRRKIEEAKSTAAVAMMVVNTMSSANMCADGAELSTTVCSPRTTIIC